MIDWPWRKRAARDAASPLFAWQPKQGLNVGDHLAAVIASEMLKHRDLSPADKRDPTRRLFSIGSVLHYARDGDCVWGTGVNGKVDPARHVFRQLDIRAVRGPLTHRFLTRRGLECPEVYGDPALLMPLFFDKALLAQGRGPVEFVVVPHLNDDLRAYDRYRHRLVLPSWPPARFAAALVRAGRVVSSSLHGVVVAEAYGVAAVRLDLGGTETDFKYDDYAQGTGRERLATATNVEDCLRLDAGAPLALERLQGGLKRSFPYDLWEGEGVRHSAA